MIMGDLSAEPQSQTCSLRTAGIFIAAAVELFEHFSLFFIRYPLPFIFHREDDMGRGFLQRYGDRTSARSIFYRILREVVDQYLQEQAVSKEAQSRFDGFFPFPFGEAAHEIGNGLPDKHRKIQ